MPSIFIWFDVKGNKLFCQLCMHAQLLRYRGAGVSSSVELSVYTQVIIPDFICHNCYCIQTYGKDTLVGKAPQGTGSRGYTGEFQWRNLPSDACIGNLPSDACIGNLPSDACIGNLPSDACIGNLSRQQTC